MVLILCLHFSERKLNVPETVYVSEQHIHAELKIGHTEAEHEAESWATGYFKKKVIESSLEGKCKCVRSVNDQEDCLYIPVHTGTYYTGITLIPDAITC